MWISSHTNPGDGYLRVQRVASFHSCQGALTTTQVLDHHLAKSIVHVHLCTWIMLGEGSTFILNTFLSTNS